MDLKLTQIHEYKVFKDTGKAQFHNGKVVTPDGFQKIRVHFVYAVKQVTYEPLTLISKDDPITCAVYAKKHDLLDTTGW